MSTNPTSILPDGTMRDVQPITGSVSQMTEPIIMTNSPVLQAMPGNTPPPPQIAQKLSSIPLGYQFAYNQLVSPTPYGNKISAYRIYRNTKSNNFSGALLIRTIVHDPTHQGSVTVQDSVLGTQTYYYFITAVDSFGQESTNNSFQSGAVTSGNANPNALNVVGTTSNPTTTSGTYVVMPEMTITATFHGGKVLLIFTGTIQYTSTSTQASVAFFRDGVQLSKDILWVPFGTTGLVIAVSYIDSSAAAGSHTYDLRWHGDGISTLTASATLRQMQAVELG